MVNYYVDHGAYTSALGTTPTWGVPQEGDGTSKDAATASSVASIVLNMQPDAGDLLTICGLTLGATSGGTYNYTIGGTLTATIDNIVAAINGNAGIGAATVGATVAVGTPKVCNLMFARNTSGTTIEIMMRVGSTTLNHATNSNVAIASANWTTPPTITQFIGGSGGCWGWLLNTSAIGVSSSIAVLAYGVMFFTPMVWSATPTLLDIIWSRTGSGKTISYTHTNSTGIYRAVTWPMRLVFDSNTQWTSDSGTGVVTLTLAVNAASSNYCYPNASASCEVLWHAMRQGGLKFVTSHTSAGRMYTFSVNGADTSFTASNIEFVDDTAGSLTNSGLLFGADGTIANNTYSLMRLRNCKYSRPSLSASLYTLFTYGNTNRNIAMVIEGCTFTWNISGASNPGAIVAVIGVVATSMSIQFIGCTFSGWASGSDLFTLMNPMATKPTDFHCLADGCTGLALTASYVGVADTTYRYRYDPIKNGNFFQSGDVGGPFRYELRNGLVEWNPSASPSYPLLSATQPDGTSYSLRLVWFNNGESTIATDFRVPPMEVIYRGTAATKTITVELFLRTALLAYLDFEKVQMMVMYVNNSTNKTVSEFVAAIPASSSASWTNAASYATYEARKMTLTTANAIKQNTRIKVKLFFSAAPNGGQNETIYLDPEFAVS